MSQSTRGARSSWNILNGNDRPNGIVWLTHQTNQVKTIYSIEISRFVMDKDMTAQSREPIASSELGIRPSTPRHNIGTFQHRLSADSSTPRTSSYRNYPVERVLPIKFTSHKISVFHSESNTNGPSFCIFTATLTGRWAKSYETIPRKCQGMKDPHDQILFA